MLEAQRVTEAELGAYIQGGIVEEVKPPLATYHKCLISWTIREDIRILVFDRISTTQKC